MARSAKAEREHLRAQLRSAGCSHAQIAAEMSRRFGVRPRLAWRWAMDWTQWKLAMEYQVANPGASLSSSKVSEYEAWPHGGVEPPLEYLAGLALTFGHECAVADLVDAVDLTHLPPAVHLVIGQTTPSPRTAPIRALQDVVVDQEVAEVDLRRAWLASLDVDDAKLTYLGSAVEWIIDHDEHLPATQLRSRARELHQHVHRLLLSPQHPPARSHLYTLAAYLSGVQAALALDLGRIGPARAYAQEAFDLAEAGGIPDIVAWARAAQSLVSYYDGHYLDALAYAQDGLDRSPHGIHAVRLAVNGQARSLAKMGDHDAAARAVDHAWTVMDRHDPPHHDLTASLTTGIYCQPRTAGNAATAFLALGNTAQVEHYATLALDAF